MYEITESQRCDLLEMLEWAQSAIGGELVEAEGKPWAEVLRAEAAAVGFMRDALVEMPREQLFRALKPGTVLTMVSNDWYPDSWMLGVPRVVTIQQTGRVGLKMTRPDGDTVDSWLTIPRAAYVRIDGPDTFSVRLSPDKDEWETYRVGTLMEMAAEQ